MAKAKQPALDAPTLAALHLTAHQLGKAGYKEADIALDAILATAKRCRGCGQIRAGQIITIPNVASITIPDPTEPTGKRKLEIPKELRGKKFRLLDQFAEKTRIGVGLSARRYELEEVPQP